MNALIALILVGALGLALGRFLFLRPRPGSWYERVMLTGVEFFVLGAILGPSGTRVIDRAALAGLDPFLILALAWVGLMVGIQFRRQHVARFPRTHFRFALAEAGLSLILALGAMVAVFALWTPVAATAAERWRAALCLASVAAISSPTAAVLPRRHTAGVGHLGGLLRFVPAVAPLVGLAGIAVLFAVWHRSTPGGGGPLDAAIWLLASSGMGFLLAGVFLLLLWSSPNSEETVVVVLGMALFSGGLAAVFHLSPLVVCLIEGIVLANVRPLDERLMHLFLRWERPLYIALLVLAGATWRLDLGWGFGLAAIVAAVRLGAKRLAVAGARRLAPLPFAVPGRFALGLLPPGAMALAVAVSYQMRFHDPLTELVFASVVVSTMGITVFSRGLAERALSPPAPGTAR
jgi:hypothetical protein